MTVETMPIAPAAEPVSPLKPSEALRLGRMLVPNGAVATMFEYARGGTVVAACALGAMWVGYHGLDGPVDPSNEAQDGRYKDLDEVLGPGDVACPERDRCGAQALTWVVFHLNDDHEWSTEQIATWLEGLGL